MRREFCCSECGLIWFGEEDVSRADRCPECNSMERIYVCDTFGFAYAIDNITKRLNDSGKSIHYAKDHPYFNR